MLLNSAVPEVIVGLFFVYLLLALICSAISEWTAGILAPAPGCCARGHRQSAGRPHQPGAGGRILPPSTGAGPVARKRAGSRNLPSYIPAAVFVRVLDLTARGEAGAGHRTWSEVLADLCARIAAGETLRGIEQELLRQLEAAGLNQVKVAQLEQVTAQLATARDALAAFDLSDASATAPLVVFSSTVWLARQNGEAVRRRGERHAEPGAGQCGRTTSTDKWAAPGGANATCNTGIIGIALAVSLLLNVDTFAIVDDLMIEPTLRTAVAELASKWVAVQDRQNPRRCRRHWSSRSSWRPGLPLGWQPENLPASNDPAGWLTKLLGIIVTTIAVSLGAPFGSTCSTSSSICA